MPALARMGGSPINARLQAAARVLGLESAKGQYGLRPSALAHSGLTLADVLCGDVYLLVLEMLERDADKASLACASRVLLIEQRHLIALLDHIEFATFAKPTI